MESSLRDSNPTAVSLLLHQKDIDICVHGQILLQALIYAPHVKLSMSHILPVLFFLTIVHPVQSPRATQSRALLNDVVLM